MELLRAVLQKVNQPLSVVFNDWDYDTVTSIFQISCHSTQCFGGRYAHCAQNKLQLKPSVSIRHRSLRQKDVEYHYLELEILEL